MKFQLGRVNRIFIRLGLVLVVGWDPNPQARESVFFEIITMKAWKARTGDT